jgi:predicted enzyme related to lactoylglutathione lyase
MRRRRPQFFACPGTPGGHGRVIVALDHVVMFVPSVRAAAGWYSSALQLPISGIDDQFATIDVGSAKLSFHAADGKVPAGRAGQVAYWRVASLADTMSRLEKAGATLYRGPLAIESGQGVCQLADPFGNLIGLVGPHAGD